MENRDKIAFASDEFAEEIYKLATEVFCGGIFVNYRSVDREDVNCMDIHPCGWDFLSFEYMDNSYKDQCVHNYMFDIEVISNGIYDCHPLEGKTLKEVLEMVKESGWSLSCR